MASNSTLAVDLLFGGDGLLGEKDYGQELSLQQTKERSETTKPREGTERSRTISLARRALFHAFFAPLPTRFEF